MQLRIVFFSILWGKSVPESDLPFSALKKRLSDLESKRNIVCAALRNARHKVMRRAVSRACDMHMQSVIEGTLKKERTRVIVIKGLKACVCACG